jgi:4-hydroxy-tetrahydrodipicolinate reductase
MTPRIAINGAQGKMGTITAKTIGQNAKFKLVGEFGRHTELREAIKNSQPDIVIDFTTASSAFENAQIIIESGVRAIIGTTGFSPQQIATLKRACSKKKLGVIIAPNFSISALLLMRLAKEVANYLPYVEIIEAHHENKEEAPSGTAIKTAEMINQARAKTKKIKSNELITGARGADKDGIPIHSIRLPGFLAHEEIIFGSPGETLHLKHNTIDRNAFMPGVLLACEKVMKLDSLVYGLEDLLFGK